MRPTGDCERQGFPDGALEPWDELATDVDTALLETAARSLGLLAQVVTELVAALTRPAMDLPAFLRRLERSAPHTALVIGAHLDVEPYVELAEASRDVAGPGGPQAAVSAIPDLLQSGSDEGLQALVDADYASEITGRRSPSMKRLGGVLREGLGNVLGDRAGWGFASAKRVVAPGVSPWTALGSCSHMSSIVSL